MAPAIQKPDFVRRKAKVGKRAPQPANLTETSFQKATVKVRSQIVQQRDASTNTNTTTILSSSRGHSLADFQLQLQHPAPAVRVSAAKGLKDLVDHHHHHHERWEETTNYLSQLLPLVSKCLVDADDTVRSVGLAIWKQLLLLGSGSSNNNNNVHTTNDQRRQRNTATTMNACWLPFAPLVMATLSCALNSLDARTRQDGATAVSMTCQRLPTVVQPHALQLLPAVTRLLLQETTTVFPNNNSNNHNNNNNNNHQSTEVSQQQKQQPDKKRKRALQALAAGNSSSLEALLSLLQTLEPSEATDTPPPPQQQQKASSSSKIILNPDMIVVEHSRARNSLLLVQAPVYYSKDPQLDLADSTAALSHFINKTTTTTTCHNSRTTNTTNSLSSTADASFLSTTLVQVLTVLRNALVEATQRNLTASNKDLQILLTVSKSIQCVWEYASKQWKDTSSSSSLLEPICKHIAKLLLELFPFKKQQPSSNSSGMTDELNARLCINILSIHHESLPWRKAVTSYMETALTIPSNKEEEEADDDDNGNNNTSSSPTHSWETHRHVLKVLRQLVWLQVSPDDDDDDDDDNKKMRVKLVQSFCRAFFDPNKLSSKMARSASGVDAAQLGCHLLEMYLYDLIALETEFGPTTASTIVRGLPDYLRHWRQDFSQSSYAAVQVLHHIARRYTTTVNESQLLLVGSIRDKLGVLLTTSPPGTFETYLEPLQRLLVSTIVLLGTPSVATIAWFGQTCLSSRAKEPVSISSQMVSFLLHSIHSIRRELPMQSYLTFVMDSTGLMSINDTQLCRSSNKGNAASRPWQRMLALDSGLVEACRCFIDCGASKVLKMLEQLLQAWLKKGATVNSNIKSCDLLRVRAALGMMSLLNLSLTDESSALDEASIWTVLSDESRNLAAVAVVSILCQIPTKTQAVDESFHPWTRPIVALLSKDSSLFKICVDVSCDKLLELDSTLQTTLITSLSQLLLHAPDLKAMVQEGYSSFEERINSVMSHFPENGPVHAQLERLSTGLALVGEEVNTPMHILS
jgi:hypothetical protein